MRNTIDGFDENHFNNKHTSIDGLGTIRRCYRLLSKFGVIMMKVLSGGSSIHCPPDRDFICERTVTSVPSEVFISKIES